MKCCELPTNSNFNHCGACHQTFASLSLFDDHQTVNYQGKPAVHCKSPVRMRLVDRGGVWYTPEGAKRAETRATLVARARSERTA